MALQAPEASVERLPRELLSKLTSLLDTNSRAACRLCSRAWRRAFDSSARRLRVTYGSIVAEQRPPEPVSRMFQSLRGLLSRGCQPHSLSLRLEEEDVDRAAKGLAVMRALSPARSLMELRLHGLPMGPELAACITAAAPRLTSLTLSGAASSRRSLQSGLRPLLRGVHRLQNLTLLNLGAAAADFNEMVTEAALPGGSSSGALMTGLLPRQALGEHTALTSLSLHLAGPWGTEASECLAQDLAAVTQLQALNIDETRTDRHDYMVDGRRKFEDFHLTAVLAMICSKLTGLTSLTLRMRKSPPDLLQHLASLAQLQELSLSSLMMIQDVSFLPQLTALTRLTLSTPLTTSIDEAIASSPDRTWGLPPQLQSLRMNSPLSLAHLSALSPPKTLQHIRLSREPVMLSSAVVAPQQVEAFARKLAGRGLERLALRAPSSWTWSVNEGALVETTQGPCMSLAALGPLQLRTLELHDMKLHRTDIKALVAALGGSLVELELHSCDISAAETLVALLRLHHLQQLSLISSTVLPFPRDRRLSRQQASLLLSPCLRLLELKRAAAEAARLEAAVVLRAGDDAAVAAAAEGACAAAAVFNRSAAVAVKVVETAVCTATAPTAKTAGQILAAAMRGLKTSAAEAEAAVAAARGDGTVCPILLHSVLMESALLLLVVGRDVKIQLRSCSGVLTDAGVAARQRVAGLLGVGAACSGGLEVRR